MTEPETTMVAVDGTDALAFVIIRHGSTEGSIALEAAARGMSKQAAAHVLRHIAQMWEQEEQA